MTPMISMTSHCDVKQSPGETWVHVPVILRMTKTHIKRPLNSFMVWSTEERKRMVTAHVGMTNSAISKLLGSKWRQLPEEEKKKWKEAAKRLKVEHSIQYPEYKYKPNKGAHT